MNEKLWKVADGEQLWTEGESCARCDSPPAVSKGDSERGLKWWGGLAGQMIAKFSNFPKSFWENLAA